VLRRMTRVSQRRRRQHPLCPSFAMRSTSTAVGGSSPNEPPVASHPKPSCRLTIEYTQDDVRETTMR
jgi:hypothetical protein